MNCVLKNRTIISIVYEGDELAEQSFLSHSKPLAQSFRCSVAFIYIGVKSSRMTSREEVGEQCPRGFQSIPIPSERRIEVPSHAECVSFALAIDLLSDSEYVADDTPIRSQADGQIIVVGGPSLRFDHGR
ncbi:MAG: hypothetical protein ABT10_21655 [Novosphingobium sp. SCN 63-17]|nr:MAG: hypothetical protein ABT10_21655 [Novosphingobium sp. SCN 63-17]OJX90913.1 MAG: hypothetical protein BGP00_04790 [Novosphingobium sp. 63-713]